TELLDLLHSVQVPGGGALEELLGVVAGGPGEPAPHRAVGPAHAPLAAQLAGQAVGTLQDRAVDDHGDGDAVPELKQHDALGPRYEVMLGEGRELDVVLDLDRAAEPLREGAGEIDPLEGGCGQAAADAPGGVEDAGHRDADGRRGQTGPAHGLDKRRD